MKLRLQRFETKAELLMGTFENINLRVRTVQNQNMEQESQGGTSYEEGEIPEERNIYICFLSYIILYKKKLIRLSKI